MSNLTEQLCESLNTYCFDKIYNQPQAELRVNVHPHMLTTRSISGGFDINDGTYITLPTLNEPYYVYALHRENIHGLILPNIEKRMWVSCTDLCNIHDLLVHIYLPNGRMIHKDSSFIYWKCDESVAYLAIKKSNATTIGEHTQMNTMYVTLYKDSDIVNKISTFSYKTPELDDNYSNRQLIWNTIFQAASQQKPYTIFVDGYETIVRNVIDIPTNAYVDIVVDENILFEFTVNLSDVKQNVGYFSDMDSTYKQLIHIPKALNPDNKVLTHNTMEIYVRSNQENKGLYLHRCANRTVTQVTHNDISIPMFVVDAYRDDLDTQDISIHIVVRKHYNDNLLIRDKNYIDLLYTHADDDLIIKHLLGEISPKLNFWKASELEKSTYVQMMFEVPNWFTPQNVWKYVEGLGYYHTISLLCKRIVSTIITDWFAGSLQFPKPYLYANEDVFPIVYLNNIKVPWNQITVDNNIINKTTIGFTSSTYYQIGDKMTVEMFVSGSNKTFQFTPTADDNKIILPYKDYILLERIESDYPTKSYERTDRFAYKQITNVLGNVVYKDVVGGCELTFGPLMYDREFILQNSLTTYTFTKRLDNNMLLGDPLILDLEVATFSLTPLNVPIFNTSCVDAYLNNKYLVPDIDYKLIKNVDYNGNFVVTQLILQNMEYLNITNNNLEVLVSSAKIDNETYGFVIEDRADTENDDITIFFDTLTMFHVNGILEPEPQYRGAYFLLEKDKYENGKPFHARTAVPQPIKKFIDTYHNNDDIGRIKILNEYFFGNMDKRPGLIILDINSYRIFSPYMATIIRDVLNDTLQPVAIDPDISKMLLSLKQYQKFFDNDICHTHTFNKHFLDCYPHYKQYVISDSFKLRYINDLTRALMPKDEIGSGKNVYW